ncbi:creatininase family protein [Bacillus sp. V2I10]|uniref:creatininase family protein n=1 Tax=Bacillus sp. V2I10 TaxID=3042276 RepID=UPI00278365D4|nr:creatininase family protein [Bacillus sp. V2I10]MDQ0862318.1 creatinine amidohydrolase [Bacillus sp. V2I10]
MNALELHGRQLDEFKKAAFVVLPLGSFEYHGPHSPYGTDIILAEGFGDLIQKDLGGIVYPTVPYSSCPGKTAKYPGTISVRPSIMLEYLSDILQGILELGTERIVLLNAHDANMGLSRSVAEYITIHYPNAKFLLINWWQMVEVGKAEELGFIGTTGRGHGGPFEMSTVKAFRPDLVNVEREDNEFNETNKYSTLPYITVEGTPESWDGYTGLIKQTAQEKGEVIVRAAADNMNKLIKNWLIGTERGD